MQTFGKDSGSQKNNLVDIDYDYFKKLDGHYDKHVIEQAEFGNISKQEYFHNALDLATSTRDNILSKELSGGRKVIYNTLSNELVIVHNGSNIGTFFKPTDGLDYFDRLN